VLPCQSKAEVQAEEAEEDELDVYGRFASLKDTFTLCNN
jgi:hypothetical protein